MRLASGCVRRAHARSPSPRRSSGATPRPDRAARGAGARGVAPGRRRRASGPARDPPGLVVEAVDLGHGPAVPFPLRDPEMGVGVGRDLRQVGHAQDLVAPGQRPQAPADRVGAPAADPVSISSKTSVGRLVDLGEDLLDRERDATQLAARGDPGERPGRLAGVRREQEHDLVDAARVEGDGVAIDLDRRLVAAGVRRPRATSNTPPGSRAPRAPPPTPSASARPPSPAQPTGRRGGRHLRQEPRVLGQRAVALALERRAAARPRRRPLAVGDAPRPRRRRSAARGRRSCDSRSSSAGERAGSWSRSRPARGPRRRRRRASASRPPSRSASGSNRPSSRAGRAPRRAAAAMRSRAPRSSPASASVERRAAAGDRLAVLRRLEPSPDLVGLARPQPARPRSRSPRARRAPACGPARAGRARAPPAPPGSPASARPPRPRAARPRLVPAEGVEQVALPALVEEPLLLVLAVDLDERRRRRPRGGPR